MKDRASVTKRDVFVAFGCVVFVLANLGAVGSSGRRRAKEAVCLSNLLKWGIVWKSYTDDRDGYFPDRGEMAFEWPFTALSYYRNSKLLFCPEATKPYTERGQPPFAAWNAWAHDEMRIDGSYCINYWLANDDHPKFWRTPYVKGAALVPLLSDGNWKDAEPYPDDEPPEYEGYWWEPNTNEMKRVCVNRHRGAVNVVFLDFSARKVGLKELWRLWWHRNWPTDPPLPNPSWPGGDWPDWMQNFKDY